MARRKVGDKQISIGNVSHVSGKVTIAGGDVYEGVTLEQVSLFLEEFTTKYQRKIFDGRCPYKGLEVFEEEDADLFFGRERLVDDLLSRVKASRTVFITGPSGSGKSSLVRAGLLHALRQGAVRDLHSERWLYETLKPGREPVKDLSLAFSRLKGPDLADYFLAHARETDVLNKCAESVLSGQKTQRFVLFVDQFEEVFTQINGEDERQAFINMLAHAGTVEDGRVIVLFAMRSDFVSNCAAYPALNELLSQEFRQIGAMQPEELVSAIALPAIQVGLPIEDDLIARIINDMKGEPGALPLMQFALKDLFDSQQAKDGVIQLTLGDYLRHGGIQKSLERHADASLAALDEKSQTLARSIFSGLIEVGRGTQDTKRTALFDELVPADASPGEVLAIVQKLADARLIITDEQAGKDTVTISHEKLIEAWPWLKKLVDENRDVIALQNEIASDAKEWEDHQRDPSYLYTGARLANAREQLEAKRLILSGTAHEFVQASIKAFSDEIEAMAQEQERQKRLQRRIIIGLISFTAAILILLVFALIQLNLSRALQLGTQAQFAFQEQHYNAAALYAFQSNQMHENNEATRVLGNLPYENFALGEGLFGHKAMVTCLAWSKDGRLASGSDDNTIIVWNLGAGKPAQTLVGQKGRFENLAWSADGRLASASDDGIVIVWNLDQGKPAQILRNREGRVESIAWSKDGRLASTSDNHAIVIWNLTTGKPDQILTVPGSYSATSLAWSSDGRLASALSDNTVVVWDLATGKPAQVMAGHTSNINSIAWSADGRLASGSNDSTVIVWDLSTGKPAQILTGHKNNVNSVAWSPDGRLASGSSDKTIIIWNLATGQPAQTLTGHSYSVDDVSWSTDGRLASAGFDDKNIIIWNLANYPSAHILAGHTDSVLSVAWSPDGRLASGSFDGTIVIWDLTHNQPALTLKVPMGFVNSVAWSADGRLASSNSLHDPNDSNIIIWDLATGQPALKILEHIRVTGVAWSPNGRLASSSWGSVIIWNLATGQPDQDLKGHTRTINGVAWSADGRLASASDDGTIIIWNLTTGKPAQVLKGHKVNSFVTSVAWSADGRLATGSTDKTVIIWDLMKGKPAMILRGHTADVNSVAWSADGRLASASDDNTIIIWDLMKGKPAQILTGHTSNVNSVAWSADGRLASASDDRVVKIARADIIRAKPCDWIYRNMTDYEWLDFQGNLYVYQPACPNLSVPKIDIFSYPFITWKGRILVLFIWGTIFAVAYKLASWLWRKLFKRFRRVPDSA